MAPLALVWQTAQLPSAASCAPRAMVAAENTDASGRAIGAIARPGRSTAPIPSAAANAAATPANTPRLAANGLRHFADGAAATGAGNAAAGSSPRSPRR